MEEPNLNIMKFFIRNHNVSSIVLKNNSFNRTLNMKIYLKSPLLMNMVIFYSSCSLKNNKFKLKLWRNLLARNQESQHAKFNGKLMKVMLNMPLIG